MPSIKRRRWRRLLIDLSVAGVTITAMLLVAEVAARWVVPQWTPESFRGTAYVRHDPLLGWSYRPNATGRFRSRDFSVAVRTNAQGHRDRDYTVEPGPGVRRAVLLGDSYAWGWGVEPDEVLDAVIEARYDNVEILNCGVMGYGTDQAYLMWRDRCAAFDPELVLLLFNANDVGNNRCGREYRRNKPLFVIDGDTLVHRNQTITPPSRLARLETAVLTRTFLLRRVYQGVYQGVDALVRWWRRDAPADEAARASVCTDQDPYQLTAALLRTLDESVRTHGARFVVAGIPPQLPGDEAVIAFLEAELAASGIPYLSLRDAFATPKAPIEFPHDKHWNAHGHALAAKAIGDALPGLWAGSEVEEGQ